MLWLFQMEFEKFIFKFQFGVYTCCAKLPYTQHPDTTMGKNKHKKVVFFFFINLMESLDRSLKAIILTHFSINLIKF